MSKNHLPQRHFDALGLSCDASAEEIREAYYRLVFECHPDRNSEDSCAAGRFKQIQIAYEVLSRRFTPTEAQIAEQFPFVTPEHSQAQLPWKWLTALVAVAVVSAMFLGVLRRRPQIPATAEAVSQLAKALPNAQPLPAVSPGNDSSVNEAGADWPALSVESLLSRVAEPIQDVLDAVLAKPSPQEDLDHRTLAHVTRKPIVDDVDSIDLAAAQERCRVLGRSGSAQLSIAPQPSVFWEFSQVDEALGGDIPDLQDSRWLTADSVNSLLRETHSPALESILSSKQYWEPRKPLPPLPHQSPHSALQGFASGADLGQGKSSNVKNRYNKSHLPSYKTTAGYSSTAVPGLTDLVQQLSPADRLNSWASSAPVPRQLATNLTKQKHLAVPELPNREAELLGFSKNFKPASSEGSLPWQAESLRGMSFEQSAFADTSTNSRTGLSQHSSRGVYLQSSASPVGNRMSRNWGTKSAAHEYSSFSNLSKALPDMNAKKNPYSQEKLKSAAAIGSYLNGPRVQSGSKFSGP